MCREYFPIKEESIEGGGIFFSLILDGIHKGHLWTCVTCEFGIGINLVIEISFLGILASVLFSTTPYSLRD